VIMGSSELIYILCCYVSSRRLLPEMRVSLAHFRRDVFPELIRFAGSYQLVNILEVLYVAILPIFILRFFGAEAAGVYAVASRVASSALVAQDALLLPILSGGAVVFASGSIERIRSFLEGSFKAMLTAALPPLAFASAFGSTMVLAWTGETGRFFGIAVSLVSLASLLKAVSLLQLVLYRTTGRALLDNIRQVLRIVILLIVAILGRRIGFYGVLTGLAVAELAGVIFMFFAMSATFRGTNPRAIGRDALKLTLATGTIIAAGFVAAGFPVPWGPTERLAAAVKLGQIGIACLISAWPALILTGAVSLEERSVVLEALMPWRRKALAIDPGARSG
jgi:O-antigen/teichoic acid export membrane protein